MCQWTINDKLREVFSQCGSIYISLFLEFLEVLEGSVFVRIIIAHALFGTYRACVVRRYLSRMRLFILQTIMLSYQVVLDAQILARALNLSTSLHWV